MNALIRVVDLETTGSRPPDAAVVEIGWQDVIIDDFGRAALAGPVGTILVDPGVPITPQTAAIHHIIDEDVLGAPAWMPTAEQVLRPADARPSAFAAHRAAFEQRWCARLTGGQPWICTFKCALRVWPEAPSFSNQSLRYWRRPAGLDRAAGSPAHRAGPDAYVTAHLLRDMIDIAGLPALLAWSAEPALFVRVPHGPERGQRFDALDEATLDRLAASSNAEIAFSARAARAARNNPVPHVQQGDLPL
jgi:exodeoxyribonuclease X